jgi:tetratricopeptide (TPR) repeat protein
VGESSIDPTQVKRQLDRISESPQFRSTGRLRDFLNFIVLETLRGQERCIKEYTIGTQVYARSALFNPKLDSIVRVEAVKLRARLDEYYAQQGSADQLIIFVPKGAYVPEFRNQTNSADQGRSCADQVAELCDLGSFSLMRRTPTAIAAATRCFILARNLSPAEGRAHIGLADSLVASLDIEAAPPCDVLGELKVSALQGLRLSGSSADAHVFASLYRATSAGLGTKATQEAQRALELEPRSAMGHFWAAGLLCAQGTHEAGIEHMREASRNAPYCTLFRAYLGRVLYYAERNQEALSVLSEVTTADPTLAVGQMWTALVHSELGQHDHAVHAGLRSVELSETSATVSCAAYVLARAGRKEEAENNFNRLTTTPPYGYVSPLQLAVIAESLDWREEAARHLALARRQNAWGLIWSDVDPRVKRIRSEP